MIALTGSALSQVDQLPASVVPEKINPAACSGQKFYSEVNAIAVTIANLRVTAKSEEHIVAVIAHFQNKADHPVFLGYVAGSVLATDDRGTRYVEREVRGTGKVTSDSMDPKVVLQAGESSDGRFELMWVGNTLFGTRFDLDMAVREIIPMVGNQFTFGREYSLHFSGLGQPPASTGPQAPIGAGPDSPLGPDCGQTPNCYTAGPFTISYGVLALPRGHMRLSDWRNTRLRFALVYVLAICSFQLSPLVSHAQNLGTQPATGKAVQGQTAAQPEGTVLNLVNWVGNMIPKDSMRGWNHQL